MHLTCAAIAPLVWFTVGEWRDTPSTIVNRLSRLPHTRWVVRSSCQREDTATISNAGAFLSILNVDPDQYSEAISQVIASYGDANDQDEVLIQPMLTNVQRSGVAFSHDPNTGAPYRIINWSEGEDTTLVTGGRGGRVWQQAASSSVPPPPDLADITRMVEELLDLFGGQPIDCEFAVTQDDQGWQTLWLLQVRPLITATTPESPKTQADRLEHIAERVRRAMTPHPFVSGQRTVFGIMPDWNPAEIIGIRPRPLALSLYRELVTDTIWAYQRHNYGYRNLRSFPLMPHFFGLPYIDARLSFNSFVPGDLPDELAGWLVDYYINRLLQEPELHDKVEFEIVLSCYSLDLPERLTRLRENGCSNIDCQTIGASLRRLTNRVTDPKNGLWLADAAKLQTLLARREVLTQSSDGDTLERIYWLLEDAKRYGTLPFAGLARAGFIAVQMLKSLVTVGVFSPDDYDGFLASISTVSSQLARDRATLDRTSFLSRYGHLRPGTYDLLRPRYDEAPEQYFDWSQTPPEPEHARPFTITLPQMREVGRLLRHHDLHPDAVGLFDFMQSAIELREASKFEFTRNLSDLLALITVYGETHGFSRDDMSFCDIHTLKELFVGVRNPRRLLEQAIAQGRDHYSDTLALTLPPLITKPDDVWSFEWPKSVPNFITRKQVTAPVAQAATDQDRLAGRIVCIPNADPGFDWLFAYPIAGLVTAWGGANSHMAIRASELGLPAVIGAGELLYRRCALAKRLHIDCAGQQIEVLE